MRSRLPVILGATFSFLLLSIDGLAQTIPGKSILISKDTIISEEGSIIPGSIMSPDSINIQFLDYGKSIRISNVQKSFKLYYNVLAVDLHSPYYHRHLHSYDSNAVYKNPLVNSPASEDEGWLEKRGLQHQGTITRGVTVGSHQSLTMQSRLNLQLEGKLNEDLHVSANITDQQMPYLPEGNSQYLRDFDNVSVRLYNEKFSLEAGDQLWQNNNSLFGKYSRNVEGARLTFNRATAAGSSVTYAGAASAKGKFSRQALEVEDGVSGPYRIPRPSASAHVVILPGTEKIFLDGKPLMRGYDHDYIIDYNQGEVTFTNEVILTSYTRIIIEFEYTQLSYQQSSVMAGHRFTGNRFSYFIDYFRQKDNAQQTLGFDLTSKDLLAIAEHNPVENVVFLSGADSTGFDEENIMYSRKDTVTIDGRHYSIFSYSKNPETAHYRLNFRETDKGNYIVKDYTAEGRIYQWIAPENGIPQGNYEPQVVINTPETNQMLSVGGGYKINDYDALTLEISSSAYESNNLHPSGPVNGMAGLISFHGENRPVSFLEGYTFSHNLQLQLVQQDFQSLERIRSVEFERFWLSDSSKADDILISGELVLKKSSDQLLSYEISQRDKGPTHGWMHNAQVRQRYKNFFANGNIVMAESQSEEYQSQWVNYDINAFYNIKSWQPGVRLVSERNGLYRLDSLFATANNFFEKQIYLNRELEEKGKLNLLYAIREDHLPLEGEFSRFSQAHTFTANAEYENLDVRVNYRKLHFDQQSAQEEMISGDALWKNKFLKILRQEIGYGLSQGRELSRAFQFVKVIPGEGTHTWRDMNDDGVKDIDEFFEAINIDERNYIKILIPTDDYVPAYESRITYRGNLQAPEVWNNKGGFLKLISRLRGNVNYQTVRKTSSNRWSERLWAMNKNLEDSLLINERTAFNSRIQLLRTQQKLGGSIGYQQLLRKQLFQAGYQAMQKEEWTGELLYSLNMFVDLNFKGALFNESIVNDYSAKGSYYIKGSSLQPEVVWMLSQQWRISGGGGWQQRWSLNSGSEAEHKEWRFSVKHNRQETFITTDLRLINIDFTGEENSATGYALLEAMRPGRNVYWQLNVQQKLSKTLRLTIFYDGRKSEANEPVHMGRVQVTALF